MDAPTETFTDESQLLPTLYNEGDHMQAEQAPSVEPPSLVDVNKNQQSKGIRKYFTLSNLFYLYCLYEMLPSMGKKTSTSTGGSLAVRQAQLLQHFVWEPLGYVNSIAAIPRTQTTTKQSKNPQAQKNYHGYYGKDKLALYTALFSIPRRPREIKETCVNTLTGALGTEEFDEQPPCIPDVKNTPPVNKAGIAEALSYSVVVLDLKLGAEPTKVVSWVRSAVDFLIGAVSETKSKGLEVLVKLESNGGSVNSYGLLTEQFRRLREDPNINITVSCDLVCASGGYLAASLATPGKLLASPFATIGSIGVTRGASLDLQGLMEKHGIKEVQIKSGERKGALGMIGSLTIEEMKYEQERTDAIHQVFREHILRWRGDIIDDIDFVSSGDHWLGIHARDHGLVDQLITSDEYLNEKIKDGCNVIGMKELTKQKSVLGDGESTSWFWTILDWLLPAAEDSQVMIDSSGRLARVLRLLQENA